jgi:RimJ/RimL family protein N-acetyltransferase
MTLILETERLHLREFSLEDAGFMLELLNSPGWLEFIGDRHVETEEDARWYLRTGPLQSYEVYGFGMWLVELKNEQTPIGICGILKRNTLEHPDIGFAFLPAFTGKGYAFEIASATLAFAKNTLHLPTILAITVPHNQASISLLEKIGLEYQQTINNADNGEKLLLYGTAAT